MNLADYVRILVRRGWIMVLLAAVTAVAAFAFSKQMTPVYRSTQKVLIIPSRMDLGLTEAATRLLNNHVAYLQSELRAAEVIDRLSLDMTPGALLGNVTIASDQLSLVIQIDVDMTEPDVANDVARVWGDLLVEFRNDQNQQARREDRIGAQVQDSPRASLLRPNVTINTVVGAIAGFFIGGIIVFVLEYLESSIIRRREDIERSVELPVLAAVPAGD